MADFVAVLRKTLDGIGDPTPETRQRVYERARSTVLARLEAISPPPPASVKDRQVKALEDAIVVIEQDYAPAAPKKLDPLDELEDVFASLNGLRDRATIPARPAPVPVRPASTPSGLPTSRGVSDSRPVGSLTPVQGASPAQPHGSPRGVEPLSAAPPLRNTKPEPEPAWSENEEQPLAESEARSYGGEADVAPRRSGFGRAVAAILVLAALAGGAYGVWLNKDDFSRLVGLTPPAGTSTTPLQTQPSPKPAKVAAAPAAPTPPKAETPPAASAQPATTAASQRSAVGATKLTQRLNEDGSELDPGPAPGQPSLGEGTTVAEVTQPAGAPEAPLSQSPASPATGETTGAATPPPATPPAVEPDPNAPAPADTGATPATADAETAGAAPAAPSEAGTLTTPPADTAAAETPAATPPADPTATAAAGDQSGTEPSLAVGQKAIFYEERTTSAQGSAEPGSTVWSLVQELPGGDRPAEPAIRAEATIPGKDVQLRMTIRRNADPTLPASHIVEMIFLTPENFDGGGVDSVLRIAMKNSEQDTGSPLIGIPAKIADGFFLIAMNDNKAEIDANMNLLLRQSWIDIPIVYKSGRRALITMEKGVPGEKVFDEALKAWGVSTSG